MKLSELPVGSHAVVRAVGSCVTGLGTRLEHVGFLPGTLVRIERRAPMGDPTVYELRGYRIAVRRESAVLVEVDEIDPTTGEVREPESSGAVSGPDRP
jgi:ferrous iron transport protein A